jgi:hypothetical protein
MFRPIRMDHTNCLQVAIKTLQFKTPGHAHQLTSSGWQSQACGMIFALVDPVPQYLETRELNPRSSWFVSSSTWVNAL